VLLLLLLLLPVQVSAVIVLLLVMPACAIATANPEGSSVGTIHKSSRKLAQPRDVTFDKSKCSRNAVRDLKRDARHLGVCNMGQAACCGPLSRKCYKDTLVDFRCKEGYSGKWCCKE
jgi:hypothetical protein